MSFDYDVLVLGGGSAGTAAAATAENLGARAAMVNDGELGGLCILRGCMPTKTLLASTHALHALEQTANLGVHVDRDGVSYDFPFIMRRKDQLVERFKRAKLDAIDSANYEVIDGRGTFIDGQTVDVGGRRLTANRIILTTGSVPIIRDIPGIDRIRVLTSDDLMRLTEPPASLLVHGAGPVGLEFAEFFARLGVPTTLVNRSQPFSKLDPDIAAEFAGVCAVQPNLIVLAPAHIQHFTPTGAGFVATVETADGVRQCECAAYMSALGRRAAVDGLHLDAAGIAMDNGFVQHDKYMRTTAETVYVAGDATGANQILHIANQEGGVAGHNAAVGRSERPMDYRLLMAVVFTDPPAAWVGQTAAQAAAAGHDVVTAVKRFSEQGRGITMDVAHGLVKLVVDRAGGEILGCQMLGPRADDLIHIPATVMAQHGTAEDLYNLPWYHPTLAEAFVEVARGALAQLDPATTPPGQS